MAGTDLPVGQYVQFNAGVQSPRAERPTAVEQTIGVIRQAYTAAGDMFYQVVWNPGSSNPATALYTQEQLTPIDQKRANEIAAQMNAGTWTPNVGSPGSEYNEPGVPTEALPPSMQDSNTNVHFTGTVNNGGSSSA